MPQTYSSSNFLIREIADVLKIHRPIMSITLRAGCMALATVVVEFAPTVDEGDAIGSLLKKYALLRIESDPSSSQ